MPDRKEAIELLETVKRRHVQHVFTRFGGHREKTAKALGIPVRTLTGYLRSCGVAPRSRDWPQDKQQLPAREATPP